MKPLKFDIGAEFLFRDQLLSIIRDAGFPASKEVAMFRNWDAPILLRADIIIGSGRIGAEAVIECKCSCDAQSLSSALGQSMLYRRAFGANHAIICFPSSLRLPGLFVEVCHEANIVLASEATIVRQLDPDGTRTRRRDEGRDNDIQPIVKSHSYL